MLHPGTLALFEPNVRIVVRKLSFLVIDGFIFVGCFLLILCLVRVFFVDLLVLSARTAASEPTSTGAAASLLLNALFLVSRSRSAISLLLFLSFFAFLAGLLGLLATLHFLHGCLVVIFGCLLNNRIMLNFANNLVEDFGDVKVCQRGHLTNLDAREHVQQARYIFLSDCATCLAVHTQVLLVSDDNLFGEVRLRFLFSAASPEASTLLLGLLQLMNSLYDAHQTVKRALVGRIEDKHVGVDIIHPVI